MATRCGYDRYGRYRCTRSAWDNWVRWLVMGLIILGFFLLFFICSCLTARRRRKAGRQPFYGTGWLARNQGNDPTQQPYYSNNQYNQPAPPYSPPAQTTHNNSYYGNNQGYYGTPYGQQQQGVELQSPQPTYGGDQHYAPPPGPPPNKA